MAHLTWKPLRTLIISCVVLTFFAMLTSCAVGPDFTRPEISLPEDFAKESGVPNLEKKPESVDELTEKAAEPIWWSHFHDDMLASLISEATNNNLGFRAATQRILQAKAATRETFFGLFPKPSIFSSYSKTKTSAARFPGIAQRGFEAEVFSLGGEASWEIDLFGRLRRSVEVADSQTEFTIYSALDTLRLIQAEVASTYIDLRGAQMLKQIAKENAGKQRSILQLIKKRLEVGDVGPIDAALASAFTNTTEATIPALQARIDSSIFKLATLLGTHRENLPKEILEDGSIPTYKGPNTIPSPYSLLRTRPDIRAAEAKAHAATAEVGIEIASLFPIINFTGSFSNDARKPNDWFTGASEAYNYGPRISWSILNLGIVLNRIDSSKASAKAGILEYEQVVLRALEETEASTSMVGNSLVRENLLGLALNSSKEAERISTLQYKTGILSYFDLLESQRNSLSAESAFIESQVQTAQSFVSLYRALGGGWFDAEESEKKESVK